MATMKGKLYVERAAAQRGSRHTLPNCHVVLEAVK